MIKRVLCVMAAVMVASSSAMAWSAESFIGNDYDNQETYSFEPIYDYPMQQPLKSAPMMMRSVSPLSDTASGYDAPNMQSVDFSNVNLPQVSSEGYWLEAYGTVYVPPDYSLDTPFSAGEAFYGDWQYSGTSSNHYISPGNSRLTYDSSGWSDVSYMAFRSTAFEFSYDLDVDGSSSSIQLDFNLQAFGQWFRPVNVNSNASVIMDLIVNDQRIYSYGVSGQRLNQSLTFNFTEPITSASLNFLVSGSSLSQGLPADDDETGSVNVCYRVKIPADCYINYALITSGALDGMNDMGQDAINQHDAIESEWTGSMTSNFNALSIETFSFPSGLISAFGLITGIFNDLWNGMGEYKIAYVFPLTLGIALLLIGRISKFDGGQSSSKRNRGDDGA